MASINLSRGGKCTSPIRNDFSSTQVMRETPEYLASVSREAPAETPVRGQGANGGSRVLQTSLRQRSKASPLSVQKLSGCMSPPLSARTKPSGDLCPMKGAASGRHTGPRTVSGMGLANTARGPAGATCVVRVDQHPLYTGNSNSSNSAQRSKLRKLSAAHLTQQRAPPPPLDPGTATVPLMISTENSTVRGLRGSAANASAAAAAVLTHASRRRSVIERIAEAAGLEKTDTGDAGTTQHLLKAEQCLLGPAPRGAATARLQSPSSGDAHRTGTRASQALPSLGIQETMKMRLQQPPSNVLGESSLAQLRLPTDALVMRPPVTAQEGGENATSAHAAAIKAPLEGSGGNAEPVKAPTAAPTAAPMAASLTGGDAGATAPPSCAPTAVPPTSSPSPSGATATDAIKGIVMATTTAAPPPPLSASTVGAASLLAVSSSSPRPSNEAPTTTEAAKLSDGALSSQPSGQPSVATVAAAAAAPSPVHPSLPILHTSLREPTSEERAAAESDRLLKDLIDSAAHRKSRLAEPGWKSQGGLSYAESLYAAASPDALTEADMAALYVQREVKQKRGLYGWQQPPPNVLLPDPSQPEATWVVLGNASAQEAQQTTASQVIAESAEAADAKSKAAAGARHATHKDDPAALNAEALDDVSASVVHCIDYHAPFQEVLHPESVVCSNALPGSSDGVADARAEAQHPRISSAEGATNSLSERRPTGNAVKSFASQAVVLHDALSLLACEQLADDTIGMLARRQAYRTAMAQLNGTLCGASLSPRKRRPSALPSVLQPAAPPVEVFCELSYQAKVLLSAILYMRALGALPTLLRVGPLSEYSPVVDKANCIELVFYNPSDEEHRQLEAQKAQQARCRRQKLERQCRAMSGRSQSSMTRSHSATMPPMRASQRRARSQPPMRSLELSPGSHSGSALRSRPRSLYITTTTRNCTANDNSAGDLEEPVHHVPSTGYTHRSSPLSRGGSALSPMSPGERSQQSLQQALQQRKNTVESLLMQSLTNVVIRRSGSAVPQPGVAPLNSKADQVFGVTSNSPLTGAGIASLANPLLHSAEPSLLMEDTSEGSPSAYGTYRKPTFYESGGAFPQRSPSPESTSRVHLKPWSSSNAEAPNDEHYKASSAPSSSVLRQRRGSECCVGAGSASIPHIGGGELRTAVSPNRCVSLSAAIPLLNRLADGVPQSSSSLRRSSVQIAMNDILRSVEREKPGSPAPASPHATKAASPASPFAQRSGAHPQASAFHSSARFGSTLEAATAAPAAPGARPAKPASPYGSGMPRFPEGERELCVVLRAVIAQKSHVHAFGKSETVHVLPPLPPRTIDDNNEDTLLFKQTQKNEMDRLALDASNPLVKFLCGTRLRNAGDAGAEERENEAEQRKLLLRARARCAAAAVRQHALTLTGADGKPAVDDYGDIVVAFVLSQGPSELSGSVPDMMELETLRYRIFTLQGYSSADPSGIHTVRAAGAATAERAAAAAATTLAAPLAADTLSPPFAKDSVASTRASSPLDDAQARLQQQLSSYIAFQRSNTTTMSMADARAFSPETSLVTEASLGLSRASLRGLSHRVSFFESALRKSDPAYARSGSNDVAGGEFMSDFDLQLLRQRQCQQQRAVMQARYPLYRASSIAESTLQAFHAEAKAAVMATRRRQRPVEGGGGSDHRCSSRSNSDGGMHEQRHDTNSGDESRKLFAGQRKSAGVGAGGASVVDPTEALQAAERDLLHFRPMNLNSFHRELLEVVQYAMDLQIRQSKEKVIHAFHV
ncbi:hypothetical protein ABL78_5799 [Leptomonas seymouri]|uniref:Uncharacterized protein n=1 Tax=Leptomonas seymouri TaxID=5684 RepID=A0A0N0P4C7_LEPSE|nr:hypothetical protein ABL78_5799 [Leptomonas seymouri]|eukprot:KPI85139.1 hypothetical protein ABL78_5799 [Leptomonas seymouri]